MHDAPGGKQNMKTFEYLNEYHRIIMPWGFLNPVLEQKIRENEEFYNQEENTFIQNCNLNNLIIFIKQQESFESTEYMNTLLNNIRNFRQPWYFLCLKNEDYIYLRGKKTFVNEGWIVKIINSGKIDYIPSDIYNKELDIEEYDYLPSMKVKIIGKVSDDTYKKISGNPSSLWKIRKPEYIEILRNEIRTLEV